MTGQLIGPERPLAEVGDGLPALRQIEVSEMAGRARHKGHLVIIPGREDLIAEGEPTDIIIWR
jgi:hypothetical protein